MAIVYNVNESGTLNSSRVARHKSQVTAGEKLQGVTQKLKSSFRRKPESRNIDDTGPRLSSFARLRRTGRRGDVKGSAKTMISVSTRPPSYELLGCK